MKNLLVTISALLLATVAAPADATNFTGDQMKASWRLPTETTLFAFTMSPSPTFTVGNGIEGIGSLTNVSFNIDFGVDALTFTFLTGAFFSNNTFNGIYFEQLGDGDFGDVLSVSGIATSRLHNMGKAFSVNFAGQRYSAGDRVAIRFVPDVPEPATWAMMILGFGLIGAAARRRRSALAA